MMRDDILPGSPVGDPSIDWDAVAVARSVDEVLAACSGFPPFVTDDGRHRPRGPWWRRALRRCGFVL